MTFDRIAIGRHVVDGAGGRVAPSLTREGTVEGPYDSELEANQRLETYASVMSSNLIEEA